MVKNCRFFHPKGMKEHDETVHKNNSLKPNASYSYAQAVKNTTSPFLEQNPHIHQPVMGQSNQFQKPFSGQKSQAQEVYLYIKSGQKQIMELVMSLNKKFVELEKYSMHM